MGQTQSLKNLDKRTARREYQEDFCQAIESFREKVQENAHLPCLQPQPLLNDDEDSDNPFQRKCEISVNVRKRPLFKSESKNSEFDVVSCVNSDTVIVHDARLDSDMKTQWLRHNEFRFNRVFDEMTSNDDVYNDIVAPIVEQVQHGGNGTVFMYGQTGSGKTYTMSAIHERLAETLFLNNHSKNGIRISFFEISGDKCVDLLNHGNTVTLLKCHRHGHTRQTGASRHNHLRHRAINSSTLADADSEHFQAYPAVEPAVHTAEELLSLIRYGTEARSTAATGVHDASSRSHAILKIYLSPSSCSVKQGRRNDGGVLTLIDLAGSEHRVDSMYHTKERQQESTEINSSLLALKSCLHSRGLDGEAALFRKSKLTMILKESLTSPMARTSVIVTLSPASKDTEHSLNSLRHACVMAGQDTTQGGSETRFISGGVVTTALIGVVNLTALARQRKALAKKGVVLDLKTCNGNLDPKGGRNSSTFGDGHSFPATGHVDSNRRLSGGKANIHKLGANLRAELKRCRASLGWETNQLCRLNGVPVQVLKKALDKAGIPSSQCQRLIDENIGLINPVDVHSTTHRASNKMKNIMTMHTAISQKPQAKHRHRESIAATILKLYPTLADANCNQNSFDDCYDKSSAMNMHVTDCSNHNSEDFFLPISKSVPRGRVTKEDIHPLVFNQLPPKSPSLAEDISSYCGKKTFEVEQSFLDLDGSDFCAESVSGASTEKHNKIKAKTTSNSNGVRVNRAATLRQKHSAQKSKQLNQNNNNINNSSSKKMLHKKCWSTAIVTHSDTFDNDDNDSRENSAFKGQHGNSNSFTPGRPWATLSSTPVPSSGSQRGGMFFEVTGNINDFVDPDPESESTTMRGCHHGGGMNEPNIVWDEEPLSGVKETPRRISAGGGGWSVDLARSRYGNGLEYD